MTLSELRALIRLTLASVTDWPDATLDAWIGHAIRFYSAHYPRLLLHDLTLFAGQHAYDLPAGLLHLLAVRYPAGTASAEPMVQVGKFWRQCDGQQQVCVLRAAADDGSAPAQIVLERHPWTGEAELEYLAAHPIPVLDDDAVTVPAHHLEAITAYVEWAAHYKLECSQAPLADDATLALSQLGAEARRAWARYKDILDRLVYLAEPGPGLGIAPVWGDIGL